MRFIISILYNPLNAIPTDWHQLDKAVVRRLVLITALLAATATLTVVNALSLLGLGTYILNVPDNGYLIILTALAIPFGLLLVATVQLFEAVQYLYSFQSGLVSGRDHVRQLEEGKHQQYLAKRRERYHRTRS